MPLTKSHRPATPRRPRLRPFSLLLAALMIFSNSGRDARARQTTSPITASPPECASWPQSLSAWWPFDEKKGASIVQEIRNGNHGTPKPNGAFGGSNGPSTAAGKVNGAAYFSGNTSHQVPNHPSLNFGTGSFSISAWVRMPPTNGISNPLLDKFSLQPTSKTGYALNFLGMPAGYALELALGTGGSTLAYSYSPPVIPPSTWTHIVVTVDRTANVGTFYINGSPVGATFTPAQGNVTNNQDLLIGVTRLGWLAPGGHYVDELELFQGAIAASVVKDIYNAQSSGKCKTCDLAVGVTSSGVSISQQTTNYTVTLKSVGGLACAGAIPVSSSVAAIGSGMAPVLSFWPGPNSPPWSCAGGQTWMNCTAQLSQAPLAPGASTSVLLKVDVQSYHTNFSVFNTVNVSFADSYSGNNNAFRSDPAQP